MPIAIAKKATISGRARRFCFKEKDDCSTVSILIETGYGSKFSEKKRRMHGAEPGDPLVENLAARGIGDDQPVSRAGDGDDPLVMQPVVIRAHQHQVVQLGLPAVLPVGVDGGRSVRACRPGYFPPPRPRTGRAILTASGSP